MLSFNLKGDLFLQVCISSLWFSCYVLFFHVSFWPWFPPPASFQMEEELEQFRKESIELKLNITQLQQKQKATAREVHREMEKVWGTPTMQVPHSDIGGDRTLVKH